MNVNAGSTTRRGLETALDGAGGRVRWSLHASATEAEFRNGPDRGKRVPLVPKYRAAAILDAPLPAGLTIHADALWVGEQVLDNDDANAAPRLDAYAVVNARLVWTVRARGPRFFVEGRNLFDREYATRGIVVNAIYLTPAPGRRWLLGAEWRF